MNSKQLLKLKDEIVSFVVSTENEIVGAWEEKMVKLSEKYNFTNVIDAYKLGVNHGELSPKALDNLKEILWVQ